MTKKRVTLIKNLIDTEEKVLEYGSSIRLDCVKNIHFNLKINFVLSLSL